jgi:superfamily II DNA or RNA helicase
MTGPLHRKARELFKAGLYSGLSSFEELERRIVAFDDDKIKGDSFEVFAEAYLATQRKHDAAKVWPLSAVPLEVLQRLGLSEQDYGVDGVFQTLLGHYNAYQVKFRSARNPLTWRELSTFMGLADSPQIRSRILITNCDELPAVLNERQGFFCIRGSDLDRLEAEDFRAIKAWMAESAFERPKKLPQPHQTEALSALVPALHEHDRVSAIMACGTGKTLVALWAAERLQASRILVLLPSLALLRQTLHEWLRETSLPVLTYLCVCSDPTVKEGVDSVTTQQSDLDFEVSTDPNNVREFLDTPFVGTKVIFSTYQSANAVGVAMKPGEVFDLGVFDEAHKTAGREGRNYAFALDDSNLPIRKRLFVTATPRHYNPQQRDREGEAQVVFSMDNPKVYGPQAYCLTFGEAARRDIICNYKVIISVITSEMVTNELLSRGKVIVNGDAIRARQVANQIALRDAIEKYGVKKIFTFHKTVNSAASFVADGSEGIRTHLPDFKSYHVNGDMPTAQRERVMRGFREATRAVTSNARCLTEGVDVPAVDMVAFLSPRRSRVDIVQATGRAMRRSPGKSLGYVLVPLYVELAAGESVDDAVSRADFDEVWDVLQSLQEQDDAMAEMIRYVGEQKGRGKGFADRGFADRIDFGGPRLTLENLRAAVTTRCLESLYSTWDRWFGNLKDFRERFGHCNVETAWAEDAALGRWVTTQRAQRNMGTLNDVRVRRLDEIGFIWDYRSLKRDENWMKWYRELEKYAREHGNPHVPRTYSNTKLASWVWIQRQRRNGSFIQKGEFDRSLTQEQINLLDKLGFLWDIREDQWLEKFEKLKVFKARYGHCEIGHEEDDDSDRQKWVRVQRAVFSRGNFQPERKAMLYGIGFNWDSETDNLNWRERYEQLKRHHAEHGDTDVPSQWKGDPKLAKWVGVQRRRRKNDLIDEAKIQLLDKLGFTWKIRDRGSWDDRFAEIAAFKAKHGHCDVPLRYPENPKLGRFVSNMRAQRNARKLSADRVAKLETIGFAWASARTAGVGEEGINAGWKARFDELRRYKQARGDCAVPAKWKENKQLANWVSMQRQLKKRGELVSERIKLLEGNGFIWEAGGARQLWWEARHAELLQFKAIHGDCDVPTKYPDSPALGNWVVSQRQNKKHGKLSPEHKRLLNEAGFIWKKKPGRQN